MPGALQFNSEYLAAVSAGGANPRPATFNDVFELRAFTEHTLRTIFHLQPTPEHIIETKITFTSHDNTLMNLYRFASQHIIEASRPQPAVLYVHGGGAISCSVGTFAPQIARYADKGDMPFFAIDYRLAPENPALTPTKDVLFGLKHLLSHAAKLNIDPKRIAIMGDSAGGGLAAGAALMARDQHLSPPLAKQILLYPMLDDRTKLPDGSALEEFLIWTNSDNHLAWSALLGDDKAGREGADVSPYVAPGRAIDLRGLPSTYVDVGGLDLFLGESLSYVSRLAAADVEVEFHLLPGLPHGFEVAGKATLVQGALGARMRALKSF